MQVQCPSIKLDVSVYRWSKAEDEPTFSGSCYMSVD